MEPLFTTAGGERAGLGFAVMQSFMDKLKRAFQGAERNGRHTGKNADPPDGAQWIGVTARSTKT